MPAHHHRHQSHSFPPLLVDTTRHWLWTLTPRNPRWGRKFTKKTLIHRQRLTSCWRCRPYYPPCLVAHSNFSRNQRLTVFFFNTELKLNFPFFSPLQFRFLYWRILSLFYRYRHRLRHHTAAWTWLFVVGGNFQFNIEHKWPFISVTVLILFQKFLP